MRRALLTAALVIGVAAPASAAQARDLILDESAYWRHYFTYAPPEVPADKVRAELPKYLDKRALRRVERQARIRAKQLGKDPKDWMRHVIVEAGSNQYSFSNLNVELLRWLRTDLPPADWMTPEFNDADWARQRTVFRASRQVKAAHYRTRFEVPNPAGVRELTLDATYRGGIRVFLNGTEIARPHLPKGDLAPDAAADDYPATAYHLRDDEFLESMYHRKDGYAQYWRKVNGYVLAPEFPDGFEKIKPVYVNWQKRIKHKEFRNAGSSCTVNRKGWERIRALRNRRLSIAIAGRLLRKGENVLALEARASLVHPLATQWEKAYVRNCTWRHVGLQTLSLRGGGIPSTLRRPAGVQVWAADVHRRVHRPDYGAPARAAPAARIVAARNGTFAAQVVVGTDRELTGLKASVSPIRGLRGALTAQVRYLVPHRIHELRVGDRGRRLGNGFDFGVYDRFTRARYGDGRAEYFDHLTAAPPSKIPANSAYPVWISVRVPAGAAAGRYRGMILVQAKGLNAVSVPLDVEVLGWRIPAPEHFTTLVALEPCPYAVAEHYRVPLWSDAHFKLLDGTFRHLARVDNDWLNIPVLARTEFGNRDDSMVRVVRRRDGAYTCDFAALDRFLDLAIRHCGKPQVISFTVMHAGNPGDRRMKLPPMKVPVHDEASGKMELMLVDREMPEGPRRAFWKFLATAIHEHMRKRGLADVMYWGYTWDGIGVAPEMYEMLAEFVPGVGWTKGSHQQGPSRFNRAVATAYSPHVALSLRRSRHGWKNPEVWVTYPRYWGTVIDCSDYSPPFSFRMLPDRAIAAGSRGIGRMGVDYWGRSYLGGMEKMTYPVGVPNLFLLWPGRDGPEPSVRFEMLWEGLQETEARIFLEQATEKLRGPEHAARRRRIDELLRRRTAETLLDPPAGTNPEAVELCSIGWQTRSRKLYAMAADVAGLLGLDVDRTGVLVDVPARGRTDILLVLRNWTRRPRNWTLAVGEAPIPIDPRTKKPDPRYTAPGVPAKEWLLAKETAGSARPGTQPLTVTLDGSKLKAGVTCRGLIRFTDVASGRTDDVAVTARVGKLMLICGEERVITATAGHPAKTRFTLVNASGSELAWRVAWNVGPPTRYDRALRRHVPVPPGPAAPWMTATPPAGTLAPGDRQLVTVRVAPTERRHTTHTLTMTVTGAGGKRQVPVTVHVLPVYKAPPGRPAGAAVPLASLPKEIVSSHTEAGRRPVKHRLPFWQPSDRQKTLAIGKDAAAFKGGLLMRTRHETVLSIDGRGFRAFAAEVGPPSYFSSRTMLARWGRFKLHFEVYADGALRAHSGLMRVDDAPRRLVADVAGAKEIRLVTRCHDDTNQRSLKGCWAEPCFYRAK